MLKKQNSQNSQNNTYLLCIIAIHPLFEIGCGKTHDNDPVLHDVGQVYVVVAGYHHAATRATNFLSQNILNHVLLSILPSIALIRSVSSFLF